jgi:hypothetical protein
MEGPEKVKGILCSPVGDREQAEVTKLKDINKEGGRQYME